MINLPRASFGVTAGDAGYDELAASAHQLSDRTPNIRPSQSINDFRSIKLTISSIACTESAEMLL